MADLNDKDASGVVRIVGAGSSGLELDFISSSAIANPPLNSSGLIVRPLPFQARTYGVAVTNLVVAASPTDVFTISGSNSSIIKIHSINVSGIKTAISYVDIQLVKRSSLNTGGTSTLLTAVSFDSTNSISTAVVRSYTANPTLGTLLGIVRSKKMATPPTTPANAQQATAMIPVYFEFLSENTQPIVLNNANELVAINLNGLAQAGANYNIDITWSEI